MMLAPLLLTGLLACDEPDPFIPQAAAYTRDIRPLLVENRDVEQQFLVLVREMSSKEVLAQQLARTLSDEILPASKSLLAHTQALTPQAPPLVTLHAELYGAWQDRDHAWQDLLTAWREKDLDAFEQAVTDRDEAREREERALINIDATLRPYGYRVRRYP